MKTALVLLAALTSMTILEVTVKTQVGSEAVSLFQSLANAQVAVRPAPKVHRQCAPGKLRTAMLLDRASFAV